MTPVPPQAPQPSVWYGTDRQASTPTGPATAIAALPLRDEAPALPVAALTRDRGARSGRGPSAYGLTLSLAALLCVGGLGFAAGRLSVAPTGSGGAGTLADGAPTDIGPGSGRFADRQAQAGPTTDADADADADASPVAGTAPQIPDPGTQVDPAASPPAGGGFPGGGVPGGGFPGSVGLTGTVIAISAGAIIVETEGGQTQQVVTDDATTFHQEAPATAGDITVGAQVRISVSGGFGGRRGATGGGSSDPQTATDVLLLEP